MVSKLALHELVSDSKFSPQTFMDISGVCSIYGMPLYL